ncbi:hypothetical protein [Klebsiella pneumoniae]|uniref:hypothetical protein n=1 Tax=Klebsiella pneumoniae TaxID=573 RepID=UPI0039695C7A
MTKSTITREESVQAVFDLKVGYRLGFADIEILKRVARMALAAMDSEPVAYISKSDFDAGYLHILARRDFNKACTMPVYAAQPAPVVPEEWTIADAVKFCKETGRQDAGAAMDAWNACRAAMLQELQKSAGTEATCRGNENAQVLNTIKAPPALGFLPKTGEVQNTNSPVIPDGYVMVPMRLTAENGAKGALSGEFSETKFVNCPECFGDDECETCDGSGRIEITVPVTWTTIKEIWAKGVEHFAAAPQEVK